MKRFCLKLAAGFLSTTLVVSVALPMNVLATTIDVTESLSENATINSSSRDYSDNIIREVEEERDEFSKTFLMTDGTYYTYVSPVKIHEFVEDKWVDIDDSLSETPATISEAKSSIVQYVEEAENSLSQISTFMLNEPNTAVTVTCLGDVEQTDGGYFLPSNGALVIKPDSITQFSANNKVLLSANLTFNIEYNDSNADALLCLKMLSSQNPTLTSINNSQDIFFNYYESDKAEYVFDITDSYSKWEKATAENYGVALVAPDAEDMDPLVVSTPVLSVRYKDVAVNDTEFTYHTLDLGTAGILSINDLTNAYKLEQTIVGLDATVLPISLTRTIFSSRCSTDSYANVSSHWNYEYALSITGSFATLTLPYGVKIEYQQLSNEVTNGYQEWKQLTNTDYVRAKLFVTEKAAESGGINTDYANCYIEIDDIKYYFTAFGRLKSIQKSNKTLYVEYEYSNHLDMFVIDKLIDGDGNQYYITYSTYRIGNKSYPYASKISVSNSSGADIEYDNVPLEINISNTVANSQITSTFNYSDGKTISYIYDLEGKLLKIINADGIITELYYKSATNNYLTGYIQKSPVETEDVSGQTVITYETINQLTILSDYTYQRTYVDIHNNEEILQYDKDFKLISYEHGENITCFSYDENGDIISYATNGKIKNNLVKNGDFSEDPKTEGSWKKYSVYPDYDPDNQRGLIDNEVFSAKIGYKQTVTPLSADTTYVVSADMLITNSIPTNDYGLKMEVVVRNLDTRDIIQTIIVPFDATLLNYNQTRMIAFKSDVACYTTVSLYTDGNTGVFYVDNVKLYEASATDANILTPHISISDPISQIITDGNITQEKITHNGTSLTQTYEYDSTGSKMLSMTDYDGITTFFDYGIRSGKLSQIGFELDENECIANPISLVYNGSGLLEIVHQTVKTIENDDITLLTQYGYDSANRITSVTNNKFSYVFNYDESGNLIEMYKENNTGTNPMVTFDYADGNIGVIEYSNNYRILYTYNGDNITNITCQKLITEAETESPVTNSETTESEQIVPTEYTDVCTYNYVYENGGISQYETSWSNSKTKIRVKYTETGVEIYRVTLPEPPNEQEIAVCIYSKSNSAEQTIEKFLSTASGANVEETFTKNRTTETTVGDNKELYSVFSGNKYSALISDTNVSYSGTNNIIKDPLGRVYSKINTLSTNVTKTTLAEDETLSSTTNNANLSYSQTYSYVTLDNGDSEEQTSTLVESIVNVIDGEFEKTNEPTTYNDTTKSYNYIYDDRGNIKYVYVNESGSYHLENFYQYDKANQIIASLDKDGYATYTYDSNGNLIEKTMYDDIYPTINNQPVALDILTLSEEHWNAYDWTVAKKANLVGVDAYKSIEYVYDEFDRLIRYRENSISYDDNNNEEIKTVVLCVHIPYDAYGNPLKYVGESSSGFITADLTWNGTQLESAIIYSGEIPTQKITFKYDANGYRINKTLYEWEANDTTITEGTSIQPEDTTISGECTEESCSHSINYTSVANGIFTEAAQIDYIWDNGNLMGYSFSVNDNGNTVYIYTNILYDNNDIPCGFIAPSGLPYYFIKDASNNVTGLVGADGEIIAKLSYDVFGNVDINVYGSNAIESVMFMVTALYNPCTYKGYLYDHELGMYFIQNKCYSPAFGRFLSSDSLEDLTEPQTEILYSNPNLFCKNNPISNFDIDAEWNREKFVFNGEKTQGIEIEMSKAFLSRPFCTLYAAQILKTSGSWDYLTGLNYKNMGIERIASNLFARSVGNYAENALNRVNTTWGDGWIVNNRNSKTISIYDLDPNSNKYMQIWLAAPTIKAFAIKNGIFITV